MVLFGYIKVEFEKEEVISIFEENKYYTFKSHEIPFYLIINHYRMQPNF
jgi:hypothetical protein